MYRIISSSKDTYITNKIINNKFRATDANVGQAGTLDLFKLYGESISGSNRTPTELSRLLIKFDLSEVTNMHNEGKIDLDDSSFKSELILHDVYGGQTTPSNFHLIVFPLAKKFDEGEGFDIVNFADLGGANYVTSSVVSSTINKWNLEGAMKSGSLGDSNIDVIVSGTIGGTLKNLAPVVYFEKGDEDLTADVTTFVAASSKNQITNYGFLIAYSGSYEKDTNTYFVKRFASRNTINKALRPKLTIQYNDSKQDNHENFEFDVTGSLYLNNFSRGTLANIIPGAGKSGLTGEDCMIVKIESGSFKKIFSGSQAIRGQSGIYSSSFAISSFESALYDEAIASGSITFDETWSNEAETVTYLSSSLKILKNSTTAITYGEQRLNVSIINLRHRYKQSEFIRVRVFAQNADRNVIFKKTPLETPSEIFPNMFYSVRDVKSGDIYIPFNESNNSTKLSSDSTGMYFDFYMSSLPPGRSYVFDFLIKQSGFDQVIKDAASKFIVE
jgi:hypothetical protein